MHFLLFWELCHPSYAKTASSAVSLALRIINLQEFLQAWPWHGLCFLAINTLYLQPQTGQFTSLARRVGWCSVCSEEFAEPFRWGLAIHVVLVGWVHVNSVMLCVINCCPDSACSALLVLFSLLSLKKAYGSPLNLSASNSWSVEEACVEKTQVTFQKEIL